VFHTLITNPLTNLLIGFYQLFGQNLGLAIIFFTILLRFVLLPLTKKQIRQQRKMAEIQPKLQELQSQRKDSKQISAEELALMKQSASSCLGGCVPVLIQLPILISLNTIITKIATAGSGDIFNNVLYFDSLKHTAEQKFNTNFLGIDLAQIPSHVGFSTKLIPFAIIILLLVGTQFILSKMMMAYQNRKKADTDKKRKANERKLTKEELEKQETQERMQQMTQMQMKYVFPLLIGFASYSFTAALGIYWLTQNVFAIIQTDLQNKQLDKEFGIAPVEKKTKQKKGERIVEYEDLKTEKEPESDPKSKNKKDSVKSSKIKKAGNKKKKKR
jgi:YidC/Oxa1 family membrane protein insertase